MKSKYVSPILQMFLEGRGTIDSIGVIPKSYRLKESKYSELENFFQEKYKNFPKLMKLHNEIITELGGDISAESDYFYVQGFRFGVLLGLDIAGVIKEE